MMVNREHSGKYCGVLHVQRLTTADVPSLLNNNFAEANAVFKNEHGPKKQNIDNQ